MDNSYYVYEWFYVNTGEVFHVGKGKNKRAWQTSYRRNQYFINIIDKEKSNVSVRLYKENLTNKEACNLEIERIAYYKSINQEILFIKDCY